MRSEKRKFSGLLQVLKLIISGLGFTGMFFSVESSGRSGYGGRDAINSSPPKAATVKKSDVDAVSEGKRERLPVIVYPGGSVQARVIDDTKSHQ